MYDFFSLLKSIVITAFVVQFDEVLFISSLFRPTCTAPVCFNPASLKVKDFAMCLNKDNY